MKDHSERRYQEVPIVQKLENAIGDNAEIQALRKEYSIKCIRIIQGEAGLVALLEGHPYKNHKGVALGIPLLERATDDDTDIVSIEAQDALLRFFKQPIDLHALSHESVLDLTSRNDRTDAQHMLSAAQRYEKSNALTYATFDVLTPQDCKTDNEIEGSAPGKNLPTFGRWMKRLKKISDELQKFTIVAFWWRESEVTVIAEMTSKKHMRSSLPLQKIVVEEGMRTMLEEYGISDRVTIADSDKDPELIKELKKSDEGKDSWDSLLLDTDAGIQTDKNGLFHPDDDLHTFMIQLREIAQHMPLALLIEPDHAADEENEWSFRVFERLPEENNDGSISD